MQMIREVREIDSDKLVIRVPKEFRKKKVEIIVLPFEQAGEKKLSKENENFLNLGGSGCWEGDLDKMREGRKDLG